MKRINWAAIAKNHGYDDPVQMIKDLYEQGNSMTDIADKLILSTTAVRTFMLANGITPRSQAKLRTSPPCPECGHTGATVILSFTDPEGVTRRRSCRKCQHSFITRETALRLPGGQK